MKQNAANGSVAAWVEMFSLKWLPVASLHVRSLVLDASEARGCGRMESHAVSMELEDEEEAMGETERNAEERRGARGARGGRACELRSGSEWVRLLEDKKLLQALLPAGRKQNSAPPVRA